MYLTLFSLACCSVMRTLQLLKEQHLLIKEQQWERAALTSDLEVICDIKLIPLH